MLQLSMHEDVVIVGGARTPMAEYVGAFKDVSALELGAHADARRARARRRRSRRGSTTSSWATPCRPRATPSTARATSASRPGVPDRGPGAHREPAVRLGHPVHRLGRADDPARRGAARPSPAGMENMTPGAARHPRRAQRASRLGEGKLEDSLMVALLDTHCGLYMAQTSDNLARKHGISREEKDAYALRSQQAAAAAAERGRLQGRDRARGRRRRGARRCASRRTTTCARTRRSKAWPRSSRRSARTGSSTAGNASGIVDGAAALVVADATRRSAAACKPLARIVSWGIAGVPPGDHGHRPRARVAQGAGGGRPLARRTSTSSRSTRRSPASTWRSRRSWASTASRPTSTAAPSRSAIRWPPPARGCC